MQDNPDSMRLRAKRYRKLHPELKRRQKLRYYRQFQKNSRRKGRRWTPSELRQILARRSSDRVLSRRLGRLVQAIQMKRSQMLRSHGTQGHLTVHSW
jgi:hypothetical protein